jgi:hypothetical protein
VRCKTYYCKICAEHANKERRLLKDARTGLTHEQRVARARANIKRRQEEHGMTWFVLREASRRLLPGSDITAPLVASWADRPVVANTISQALCRLARRGAILKVSKGVFRWK